MSLLRDVHIQYIVLLSLYKGIIITVKKKKKKKKSCVQRRDEVNSV